MNSATFNTLHIYEIDRQGKGANKAVLNRKWLTLSQA